MPNGVFCAVYQNGTNNKENKKSISRAEGEEDGEFLGITMVPEEGKSVVYGMRAMLPHSSDPSDPIVQVISNLGGKEEIYNIRINDVDPRNATQLEMFALLSYSDKMNATKGGSFGSHQQFQIYVMNAMDNGYCGNLADGDIFVNKKFDWCLLLEKMMKDYMAGGIFHQYQDCRKLLDYFQEINR